jgi:hypothetical protein
MSRLELTIQMAKLVMMGIFLAITLWVILSGGLPCRIVG